MRSSSERLHVHFVDHCARMGGAQFNVIALTEDLQAAGHRVTASIAEDGPLVTRLRALGASVTVHDALGIGPSDPIEPGRPVPRVSVRAWWRFIREIRQLAPDVVHVNSTKATAVLAPLLKVAVGAPTVATVRDIVGPAHFSTAVSTAMRFVSLPAADVVVANSTSTRASLGRRNAGALVVHPGVGPVNPRPAEHTEGPLRVVMLGRLSPWKGQDVLIDALTVMTRRDVTVDIVGEAMFGEHAYADQLRDRVDGGGLRDRVRLVGTVESPKDLLAGYDVLVHASREPEAFGRVVAEGLMAGLAVVATDTGGPAEQIEHGVTGLLVPPGSVRALADALDDLAADPRRRAELAAAGLVSSARFTRARQLEGFIAAYTRATRRCPGSLPVPDVTISVVVPSYARPDSLPRTLTCLASMDEPPLEVVVVVRADDEVTREVAYAAGARVAVVEEPGLAAAMARGATAANGDVVAYTDDDAEPLPDWTSRIRAAYRDRPQLGAFGGRDLVVANSDAPRPSSDVGRITKYGRVFGFHHRGEGPAVATHQLKGVNFSVRRELVTEVDLGRRVRGTGAQHGNELFVTSWVLHRGFEVVYDPALRVVHHVEPRSDGTVRVGQRIEQLRDDVTNLVAAACGLRGVRRFSVPLFAIVIGERVRPGLVAGAVLVREGVPVADVLRLVWAVWRGAGRGLRERGRLRSEEDTR